MMNEQNQIQTQTSKTKKSYWKITIVISLAIVLVGGYLAWVNYLSPRAKSERETQLNYEKATKALSDFEQAMKNDTYGGKTPEETLQLFIDALKKGDVELASKYFALGDDGKPRQEVLGGLQKIVGEDKSQAVADTVVASKFDSRHSSDSTAWFTVENKEGVIEYSIILKLNKFSGAWKIESL